MTLISVINASPPFAFFNKVDGGWTYIGNDRQRVGWNTKAQCFTNVKYLSLRKFMRRLIFPTQINKSSFPFVFRILRQCNPFKVFGPVVRFNSVNVVNC